MAPIMGSLPHSLRLYDAVIVCIRSGECTTTPTTKQEGRSTPHTIRAFCKGLRPSWKPHTSLLRETKVGGMVTLASPEEEREELEEIVLRPEEREGQDEAGERAD